MREGDGELRNTVRGDRDFFPRTSRRLRAKDEEEIYRCTVTFGWVARHFNAALNL